MKPLYGRKGQVAYWLQDDRGDILNNAGRYVAFVVGDSVYNYCGEHVGWFQQGHIRDAQGDIALFLTEADDLGVERPALDKAPQAPCPTCPSYRPYLGYKPYRPGWRAEWSDKTPF